MAFISKIKAGDFNQRIKLKSLTTAIDDFGGVTNTYSVLATVWANKNVKTLRDIEEKFEGDELQSYGRFVYTIRYSSETKNIKSNWIVEEVETSDIYEILGFVIDPRKEFIEPTQSPV
jgi:head-tail adaptor